MAGWLVVLVDNKEYVPVSRLRKTDSGSINLTTMLPDQDQAQVELYFRGPRYLEQIHTFHLSGLREGSERPRIVVSAHRRGSVRVTLRVDGEIRDEQTFDVPLAVHRIAWAPIILVAAAVLLMGAFATAAGLGLITLPGGTGERARSATDPTAAERLITPLETVVPTDEPDEETAVDAVSVLEPVSTTVYFEPESAALVPETVAEIMEVADRIAESGVSAVELAAIGHTALFGNAAARLQLSEERAAAVARELRARLSERGVSDVEINVSGVGGSQPVTTAEAQQWRNRRVELESE